MDKKRCDCENEECEAMDIHVAGACTKAATHKETTYGFKLCTDCAFPFIYSDGRWPVAEL